ncbi:tetratricopeptide repeat (TPR)-like superfamily protein [Actinidia rufa]|uniref:Tetratricopeptide repeat (TPR)-like superfamily protein n=1 Tax=Actinidia rufa TaxID=165716 RepID=A0A7J0H353_9ERIC|nr:tetratricopeptide repeat (TPR)-like superfamily protein [Actinidia rufa]
MPGVVVDGVLEGGSSSPQPTTVEPPLNGVVEPSIEQLYDNVCEMQSSDQSPSRASFGSEGEESRIDSELRHLVGGEMRQIEIMEEEEEVEKRRDEFHSDSGSRKGNSSTGKKSGKVGNSPSTSTKSPSLEESKSASNSPLESDAFVDIEPQREKSSREASCGQEEWQYREAIPVLEHSIEIPVIEEGQDHALARICWSYAVGYLAEAHVQALQFDEAEKYCQMALDIHKENGSPASLEEAADRRLMGLICETKGDHEAALEHLVLASMAMVANGQETEVASVDCSIGDTYLSLTRYDEAVFAYQKALTVFKTSKGENHPAVASVFVRLADLYNKTGKFRESKSYCENALRIYGKAIPGIPPEEIASGLTDISAIYESMNELDQAIKLLQKALKIYNNAPGQQSTIAGIEAQIGVMYYMLGNYSDSYTSFKNAISKLRASGEKKSAFFGIALNQMGLACVQRYAINEAADLFEEARIILEHEYGPYHPDTLGVYSNLAGTYDAVGRLDDAIEILEHVVGMREEKLGDSKS